MNTVNTVNTEKKRRSAVFLFSVLFFCNILFNVLNIQVVSADGSSGYSDSGGNDILIHMNTNGLPSAPDITAKAAVVVNLETGDLVYEKNSRKIVYPASTVKIMTAILVMENVKDIENEKIIISQYVVDNASGLKLPNVPAVVGEVFTIEQLLYAMLLAGANDAALALAEYVGGTVDDFIIKMNEKAIELGCENTIFANPTGLDSESMYTTAYDVAKIAEYASKMQKIMDITSSPQFSIPATNKYAESRPFSNRNHFVTKATNSTYYYDYAKGINAGSTDEAGYCLATVAQQKALTYLCVVMGSTLTPIPGNDAGKTNSFSDARDLLDWAFSIYTYKTVVSAKKDKIVTAEIKLSANRDTVTLVPDADIPLLLPQNVDIDKEIEVRFATYDDKLVAPIEVGDCLGELTVLYNGEIVGRGKLLSTAQVERSYVLYALEQIKGIVSRSWFQASVVIFVILFVFYIIVTLIKNNKRERKRFY